MERLDMVIGAFQRDDRFFDLRGVTPIQYRSAMSETRSKRPSAGRVGVVPKAHFYKVGQQLGVLQL